MYFVGLTGPGSKLLLTFSTLNFYMSKHFKIHFLFSLKTGLDISFTVTSGGILILMSKLLFQGKVKLSNHLSITFNYSMLKIKKQNFKQFKWNGYTFKGINTDTKKLPPCSLGAILKGKNLLPLGANSFL